LRQVIRESFRVCRIRVHERRGHEAPCQGAAIRWLAIDQTYIPHFRDALQPNFPGGRWGAPVITVA